MKAVDGAYLDAVHVLALDAVLGNDKSHGVSAPSRAATLEILAADN
jgi:hypothetical protein